MFECIRLLTCCCSSSYLTCVTSIRMVVHGSLPSHPPSSGEAKACHWGQRTPMKFLKSYTNYCSSPILTLPTPSTNNDDPGDRHGWLRPWSRGSMVKVKMVPSCQPSRKDLLSAEASKKGTKKPMVNPGSMVLVWPQLASNYESRRIFF